MKKAILFFLALSLLVCLVACSSSSGGAGATTQGETQETTTPQTVAETSAGTEGETTAETTAPPLLTIPTDGLSMPDTVVVYDGEPHALTLVGEIPDGVTVVYTDNTLTDVGITTAFATLSMDGAEDATLSGILTVSPAPVDLSQVRWSAMKLGYDGEEKSVTLIGLPPSVSVVYTDNSAVAAGRYHAVAVVTAISDNYRLAETTFSLDWSIVEGAKFRFSVSGGTADQPTGELFDGTTVRITPDDPDWFLGWSLGATLENGGQFLTGQADYSFRLNSDTALFANYTAHTDGTVVYDLSGGKTKADGKGYSTAVFSSPFHLCYSTVVDNGTFYRSGYTLLEYNTEPDGSGTPVNPGGKIPVPAGSALHLYAVWAEWSPEEDFIYTVADGKATVVSYLGDDDPLVIPESLGGYQIGRASCRERVWLRV